MCALLRPLSLLFILYCLIPTSAVPPSITILSEQLYDLSTNLAKANLVQLNEIVTSGLDLIILAEESIYQGKFPEHVKDEFKRIWKHLPILYEYSQRIENLDRRIITQLVSSVSKLIRDVQEVVGNLDDLSEDIDKNQLIEGSLEFCYHRQAGRVSRPGAEALGWWVFGVVERMSLLENYADRRDVYERTIKIGEQFEKMVFQEFSIPEKRVYNIQPQIRLKMLMKIIRLAAKEDRMALVTAWKNFVDKLETVAGVKLSLGLFGFSREQYMNDICDSVVPLIRKKVNCYNEKPGPQGKTLSVTGRLRMIIEGIQDF